MKIARQALDKAIVTGDAPPIHRFKTTLGKSISQEKGKVGLGYQSVPIPKSDYLLEALPPEGKNFKQLLTTLKQDSHLITLQVQKAT